MKEEKKQPITTRQRVLTVVGIALCVILVPIVIMNCTLIVRQWIHKDEVPTFGGVFPMIVLTDSMKGTFNSGSLIFCKTIDPKDIKEGDIICFYDPVGNGTTTTTHRVQEVLTDENGRLSFRTKGDNNNTEDRFPVSADKVVGIYQFHLPGLGSFALFMQSVPGFIIFVALPVALIVAYDIIRHRMAEKKKDNDTSVLLAELEALRAEKAAKEAAKKADGETESSGDAPKGDA